MWKRTAVALSVLLVSVGYAMPADAEKCGGVSMPSSKTVDGNKLVLNGMGIREATIFSVNVYVAGLYLPSKSDDGNQIASSNEPKHIVLHFVRGVERHKIVDAWKESFKNAGVYSSEKSKVQKFLGWMSSVNEGDEQVYTYIPGKGVTVTIKGSEKGTIEGEDFAEALFKAWIGPNPPNQGLKRGLLGGYCG